MLWNIENYAGFIKMTYPNLFKNRYAELKGKNWIKSVSVEDRKAFSQIGFFHSDFGRLGGIVRGKSGKRDSKGRFIKYSDKCRIVINLVIC